MRAPRSGRLALFVAVSLGAGAAAVSIQQTIYGGLSGELVEIESALTLAPGGVAVNVLGLSSAGTTAATAIELAVLFGTATPGVTAGHYAYTLTPREASAGSVTSGTYSAELFVDDVSKSVVYFKQATSDVLNLEAVTLVWDVGTSLSPGATSYHAAVLKL